MNFMKHIKDESKGTKAEIQNKQKNLAIKKRQQ